MIACRRSRAVSYQRKGPISIRGCSAKDMAPKRKKGIPKTQSPCCSPAAVAAKKLKEKYKQQATPGKSSRARRALYDVKNNKSSHKTGSAKTKEPSETQPNYPFKLTNSVIKGYHVYQIKPPKTSPPTRLIVDREYTNVHDDKACLVWMPPLDKFNKEQHSLSTDEKRQLILSDIAGLPVGHVPKCLSSYCRDVLDSGGQIFAEVTGGPVPSFPPWPAQDQEGGGVVLPCNYIFSNINADVYFEKLRKCLKVITEGACMTVLPL